MEDALRRIGGTDVPVADVIGADSPDFYRNKVQFPAAAPDKLGFFRRRSHDVISVDNCRLQPAAAGKIRAAVLAWLRENGVTCYDESTGRGWLRHLYVRTARNGDAAACLVATGEKVKNPASLVEKIRAAYPATVGIVLNVNRRGDNVILGDEYVTLWGSDVLCDTLCGYEFSLSVPSFYQVNPPQAERLYEKALELAALTGRETVLDLYCGIGTISLCLAKRAGRVYGVEVVPEAVQNARDNARRNGVDNAEFFCADAGEAAARLERDGVRPDVVCVDPPRKGLAPDVVETIARMAPERIVYVSCDPGTLARDVKLFAGHGYAARSATPVDMFPRTEHVETVVLMTRGEVYE